jgi:DNA-binding MarR family transcriptional regulator
VQRRRPHYVINIKYTPATSRANIASMTDKSAIRDYHFSDQIGHLLRRAYQHHTATQFVTLCAIRDMQTCSLSEIVKVTAIDQGTIRGIIERLKSRHLILLSHDANDKRKVLVSLSDTGSALVTETVPFAATITEATYGNLNPGERVALVFLLRKMIDS